MMNSLQKLRNSSGQMTVELCIVFPVALVIALIALNALTFFGDCARFDRVAHNSISTLGSSPNYSLKDDGDVAADILTQIEESISADNLDVNLSFFITAEKYTTYELELIYYPTLFGIDMQKEVFGVSLPRLTHRIEYTIDPYRPGVFL